MNMNCAINTYKLFAEFYDLYTGKFNSDFEFYLSNCNQTDTILEIGCGTGRILKILLQKGCNVTGIDISQEMLNKASGKFTNQTRNGKLKLVSHDFSKAQLPERFDRALLTYYTFNYILEGQIEFLKNIYNSLNTNGLLLMDLFYPNSLSDKSINGRWIKKEYNIDGQPFKIHDRRTIDNNIEFREQIFVINGSETKIDTMRKYYSPSIMKEILISSGYQNIEFSDGYNQSGFKDIIDEKGLKNNYIVRANK